MIDLGPHAVFIVWSYLGVAILITLLVAYLVWDRNRVNARLRALEERGIRRRSGGTAE